MALSRALVISYFFACPQFYAFQVQAAGGLVRGFPGRNDFTVTDIRPDQLTLNLAEGSTWFEVCVACEQTYMWTYVHRMMDACEVRNNSSQRLSV